MKKIVLILALFGAAPQVLAQAPPSQAYNWRNVEIVGGGFVSGIIFHPREAGLVYARTDIGGVYRLDNATRRWIPLTDHFGSADWNLYGVESVALDPTDANRVYLALGTYINDWAGNGAMLRSNDRGKTWQRTDLPFKNGGNHDGRSMGERLAVNPQKPSHLLFGSRVNGLWQSLDSGATWQKQEAFPAVEKSPTAAKGIGISFITFGPENVIYAGVADKATNLYQSRDGGRSWESVPGQPRGFLPHHGVFDSRGEMYLTYGDGPGPNGMSDGAVWKFSPRSGRWSEITPVKPKTNGEGGFGYAGLTVDANRPGTLLVATMDRWAAGDDIFRSQDGGATWRSLKKFSVRDASASPFLHWTRDHADLGHWIGDVEIDPFNSDRAFYVTGATIWGSDDLRRMDASANTHWTPRADGLEETAVQDLISPPQGAHLISALADIGGFVHDDFTVSPRGGVWRNPTYSTTHSLDFAEKAPRIIVRSGNGGGGVKRAAYSLDGGASWQPVLTEPPGTQNSGPLALSCDGQSLLWSPRGLAPQLTRTWGGSWQACAGLPVGAYAVADRENPRWFYAYDKSSATLFFSDNGGESFAPRAKDLPKTDGRLRALPGRAGELWLPAGGGGLWRSRDGGATFEKLAAVQNADAVGFGAASPKNLTQLALFIAGKIGEVNGVFRSDDGGQNWTRINDDAHQYGYIGKAVIGDPRVYGRVYVATNGRGILVADPAGR